MTHGVWGSAPSKRTHIMYKNIKLLSVFFLSICIVIFPIYSYAGLPQAVSNYAVTIKNVVKTGVGVTADFAFKKRAANEPEWAAPAKSVPNTKIAGGFIKRLAGFTVGTVGFLVVEKLLEGTDWVMNPENNAIIKPAVDSIFFCVPPVAPSTTPTKCVTNPQAFISQQFPDGKPASYSTVNTDFTFTGINGYDNLSDLIAEIKGGSSKTVTLTADYTKTSYGANETVKDVTVGFTTVKSLVTYNDVQDVEITVPELAELLNNATSQDLEAIIQPQPTVDPAQDPAYEDLYAAAAAEAEPTEDPNPNPEPEPEPEPDPNTGDCPAGYVKSDNLCIQKPQSTDFPVFCDWAKPICDFFGDTTVPSIPPDTEVSIQTPEFSDPSVFDKSYITVTDQCPADIDASIPIGPISLSLPLPMSPICDFGSTYVSPVLQFLAYLSVALGISRSLRVG